MLTEVTGAEVEWARGKGGGGGGWHGRWLNRVEGDRYIMMGHYIFRTILEKKITPCSHFSDLIFQETFS